METPNVLVLKIGSMFAGKKIPFDKLYFFPRADRELIPKFFGNAFVMPVTEDLLKEISKIPPVNISVYHQQRSDSELNVPPTSTQDWWRTTIFEPYNLLDRLAVVPVLLLRRGDKRQAAYFATKEWFNQAKTPRTRYGYRSHRKSSPFPDGSTALPASFKPAFSELTYFASNRPAPNDKIRPICTHCSRALLNLQGKCTPGMAVCYTALDFAELDETKMGDTQEDNK